MQRSLAAEELADIVGGRMSQELCGSVLTASMLVFEAGGWAFAWFGAAVYLGGGCLGN